MEEAKTSKIYKELNIPGYIVDEDLLRRVDEFVPWLLPDLKVTTNREYLDIWC